MKNSLYITDSILIKQSQRDIFDLIFSVKEFGEYFPFMLRIDDISGDGKRSNKKFRWYGRKLKGRFHDIEIIDVIKDKKIIFKNSQPSGLPVNEFTLTHDEIITYSIQKVSGKICILKADMEIFTGKTEKEISVHFGMLRNYLNVVKRVSEGKGSQQVSGIVNVPIHDVFEYISDLERICKNNEKCLKVEIISNEKKGVGVRSLWYSSLDIGKTRLEEIVVFEENKKIEYLNFGLEKKKPRVKGILELVKLNQNQTRITFTEIYFWDKTQSNLITTNKMMANQIQEIKRVLEK
ncbi:MAG: SRPBCC family protein [Candidatus Ranarchaeia archaeon]